MTTAPSETAPFDDTEIVAVLESLVPILEDPDPRKRADVYTEDATFLMPGIAPVEGRAEMIRRLQTSPVLRSVTITPHTIEGRGDLAYAYGRFTCVAEGTADRPGGPVALRFLMVCRKEPDGVWRIAREFMAAEDPHGGGRPAS